MFKNLKPPQEGHFVSNGGVGNGWKPSGGAIYLLGVVVRFGLRIRKFQDNFAMYTCDPLGVFLGRSSWWFQPVWKILVNLDHLPR